MTTHKKLGNFVQQFPGFFLMLIVLDVDGILWIKGGIALSNLRWQVTPKEFVLLTSQAEPGIHHHA